MDVLNTTAREIFLGVKDRRLQDVEGIRMGVRFPAGGTITVPDALRLSTEFEELTLSGALEITAFGGEPTSTVQQEELQTTGWFALQEVILPVSFTGETVFTLPSNFEPGGFARAKINTAWYDQTVFFTISGNQMIWLNAGFSLDPADELLLWYEEEHL